MLEELIKTADLTTIEVVILAAGAVPEVAVRSRQEPGQLPDGAEDVGATGNAMARSRSS